MTISIQIARHLRDLYSGGNWTSVNYKDALSDVTFEQAITKIESFNTIATLVNHTRYFLPVQIRVLEEGVLEGKDALSWIDSPVTNKEEWQILKNNLFAEAGKLATLIEKLSDEKLNEDFVNPKYGT